MRANSVKPALRGRVEGGASRTNLIAKRPNLLVRWFNVGVTTDGQQQLKSQSTDNAQVSQVAQMSEHCPRLCIDCSTDLTGRRFYRNRHGDRRCGRCQRLRWHSKALEYRRAQFRRRTATAVVAMLLLIVAVLTIYFAPDLFKPLGAGAKSTVPTGSAPTATPDARGKSHPAPERRSAPTVIP